MPSPPEQPGPERDEELVRASELLPLVYGELRDLAHRKLRGRSRGTILHTTALAHEAWLKIAGNRPDLELSRAHFLALAATAMRQVLANYARDRNAAKRGGEWRKVTLSDAAGGDTARDLVAVSETLEQLRDLNERHGRIAELRLLSGMTVEECSEALGLSVSTIEREWRLARAWIGARLEPTG